MAQKVLGTIHAVQGVQGRKFDSHPHSPERLQYTQMVAACEAICARHGYDPSRLHVFLDYLSIPQRNMRLRLCAIDSLGVFASIFRHFVVVAPTTVHKDTGAAALDVARGGGTELADEGAEEFAEQRPDRTL